MKSSRLLLLGFLAPSAFAQWIVNDPINTGIQSAQIANHVETLRQWAAALEPRKLELTSRCQSLRVRYKAGMRRSLCILGKFRSPN